MTFHSVCSLFSGDLNIMLPTSFTIKHYYGNKVLNKYWFSLSWISSRFGLILGFRLAFSIRWFVSLSSQANLSRTKRRKRNNDEKGKKENFSRKYIFRIQSVFRAWQKYGYPMLPSGCMSRFNELTDYWVQVQKRYEFQLYKFITSISFCIVDSFPILVDIRQA